MAMQKSLFQREKAVNPSIPTTTHKSKEGVAYRDSRFLNRPDDSAVKKTLTTTKERLKIGIKSLLYKMGIKSLDFQDKN